MAIRLDRRTLLRGIGASIGLPVLECMLNTNGTAYAQGAPIPRRYALLFAGQSIGGDQWPKNRSRINGNNVTEEGHFIAPARTGRGYTATTPLMDLAAADLLGDISIVSNQRIPFDAANADASAVPDAGAFRDFHGGGCSPLISGTRSTSPNFTANGITSDQAIAELNAGRTRIESLVYRAQPSWYLSGSSYSGRQYISYRAGGGNAGRIEAQDRPQVAVQQLFQGFVPPDSGDAIRFDFNRRAKLSVLDLILDKRQSLLAKVGVADRRRLDLHFTQIRKLETDAMMIQPPPVGSCRILPDPGPDPSIGGDNAGSDSGSIGTNTGYSQETERAQLLADLIHMAFVCDMTRAATLQITTFQSHMNVLQPTTDLGFPIRADLHETGHNGDADNRGQYAVSMNLRWHLRTYQHLLTKLKTTTEGGGNMLDNTVVVFLPEGGHGRQLNDGTSEDQTHSVENMVTLIAGRAGGLMPGQHIDANGAHPVQSLIAAMRGAGYQGDSLGQVTGYTQALFG
jgi:hypothetical protein